VGDGPLSGCRVIELAGLGPAPFAGMMLADLGAEVVRVDRPGSGMFAGLEPLDLLNRGKKSVLLDLKQPEAVRAVLAMAERADVFIEGYRPGVAERLGVGPADCLARNPRLVYGRMTGWGQDGPLAQLAGHDIAYIALTGALHAIGTAGGPPQIPLNIVGDFGGGGNYLVIGVLAALNEVRRSGRGQVVDAAIVDGTAHLLAMAHSMLASGTWSDERGVNLLDGGAPFYSVYEAADGRHMAVGALEGKFYAELLVRLGLDEDPRAQYDRARWPALRARIAEALAKRTQAEWADVFAASDACVAPVVSLREAAEHPHIKARGSIVEHGGVMQPAPAPRFSLTPATLGTPPPVPGQHTEEVLAAWGISQASASPASAAAEGASPASAGQEDRRAAVAELGAELRALADLATRTEVPAGVLRETARRLRELSPALRERIRSVTEPPSADDLRGGVRMFNPVTGAGNPLAPPLRIEVGEDGVEGRCTLGLAYEGPPMHGHGGVSAMLLDQVLGHASAATGSPGVTTDLSVRYLRTVPLDVPLRVWARVVGAVGRRTSVTGAITTVDEPDVPLVEAEARFLKLRPEQARRLFAGSASPDAADPRVAHD
jgi:alpha-methylacyl-CoA racemase